jgi:hypothetical protein
MRRRLPANAKGEHEMPNFLFTYHTPQDFVPGQPEGIAAWTSWLTSLGSGLVEMGQPVTTSGEVGNCVQDTKLGGYSIVSADDLDAAKTIAKGCPAVGAGGGVVVGELGEVHTSS